MGMLSKIFIVLILPLQIFSQDASQSISELTAKMNRVTDYSADAVIKSDIPLIKILAVKATIYFKQKDKFRIISKGIAILPKQGFVDISKLLSQIDGYTSMIAGYDNVSNSKAQIITIFPVNDTSDLILAKLWVDTDRDIILKSQITTRSSGTVTIEYSYKSRNEFGLPDNMIFTVDVKKFKIPKSVATDINRTSSMDELKKSAKTGKIFISLTNYKINKGINDDIFISQTKEFNSLKK